MTQRGAEAAVWVPADEGRRQQAAARAEPVRAFPQMALNGRDGLYVNAPQTTPLLIRRLEPRAFPPGAKDNMPAHTTARNNAIAAASTTQCSISLASPVRRLKYQPYKEQSTAPVAAENKQQRGGWAFWKAHRGCRRFAYIRR